MEELVSVVMSTYNEKEVHLRKSIESIINQTYQNIEYIIILDNPDNKPIAHHKNHIKTENTRENLSWATHSENTTAYYDSKKQTQEQIESEAPAGE